MLSNCKNCGGQLVFSPKDKGNICENCSSVFNVDYKHNFFKKPFAENKELKVDPLAKELKSIKCKNCGASIIMSKLQMQAECPYCGNTSLDSENISKLMYIDSIIPFSFGKAEALSKFKTDVKKRFFADKKIFKDVLIDDVNGMYVNAFVFDMFANAIYKGVFSSRVKVKDEKGFESYQTIKKSVNGLFEKDFNNIIVEANSHITQYDLETIMPFEYTSAVEFKDDFINGYMLEYKDTMFNTCVEKAENIIKKAIEKELLKRHNCEQIESLDLKLNFENQVYNYCLIPVYFVTKTRTKDNKKFTAIINGQTGKVGRLPANKKRVFFITMAILAVIFGIILSIIYFAM
ncbi:MAG: hypothetical protein IKM43_03095 [Clostridia bacterium]|nr:hypothetical protein [Clostridia bacterium]